MNRITVIVSLLQIHTYYQLPTGYRYLHKHNLLGVEKLAYATILLTLDTKSSISNAKVIVAQVRIAMLK